MSAEPEQRGVAEATAALEEALPLARELADPDARLQALGGLLEAFATVDPTRAIALAEEISDEEERDSAVFEIAVTVARRDAEQGLTILRHYRGAPLEDSEVERLAETVAAAWPEKAVELVGGMEDRFAYYRAIVEVAEAMAEREAEVALALARTITEPALRAEALRKVAVGQLTARPEFARTIGDEVVKTAPEVEEVSDRAHLLAETARDLAPAGREWAKEVADLALAAARQTSAEGDARGRALGAVAAAMAYLYPDRAEDIAYTIEEPARRAVALAEIARALAPTQPKWAQRLVDDARAQQVEAESRGTVARAVLPVLAVLDPRAAWSFAREAMARGESTRADLAAATEAFARAHAKEALAAAEEAEDPEVREALLRAYAAAAPGRELKRVLALAERTGERRDQVLHEVVSALARVDAARALEVSRLMADPLARVLALCEAAWHMQGLEM